MKAIVLERNKMVNRRLVRHIACAGFEVCGVEDPGQLEDRLADASLVAADTFDAHVIEKAVRDKPGLRALLLTAEPLRRSLRFASENPYISNIFGRPDFESSPRRWEMMMVLRRLLKPEEGPPPFTAYLDWGFRGFQERVATTADRDAVVHRIEDCVAVLGVPKRVSEMLHELAHELLMNAMFDAPADDEGKPKYAMNRKAALELTQDEQPTLRFGTDGSRVAVQVSDPFGRLERRHVYDGLARGLEDGEMDRSHGGAGLGMAVCHNASSALFFDVVRGVKTVVTAIFDLDLNLREFRTQAKSLHFFEL
jgi:hypothetical protein